MYCVANKTKFVVFATVIWAFSDLLKTDMQLSETEFSVCLSFSLLVLDLIRKNIFSFSARSSGLHRL